MRQTQNTQKKDNRKSVFVIALLLLLVAVIGFGGYTLSKYVTKKSETGSASVAQWGYTIEADASGIFGTDYVYNTDKAASIVKTTESTGLTVSAKNTDRTNRVAPGTTGSMTFKIGGTAEVLAQIKVGVTGKDVQLVYKKNGGDETTYTPVKWTLKKGTAEIAKNLTLAGLNTELEKLYADAIAPNSAKIEDEYTISWAWAFEVDDDTNTLDTILGILAGNGTVAKEGYEVITGEGKTNTTLSFSLSISIVQLKEAA